MEKVTLETVKSPIMGTSVGQITFHDQLDDEEFKHAFLTSITNFSELVQIAITMNNLKISYKNAVKIRYKYKKIKEGNKEKNGNS